MQKDHPLKNEIISEIHENGLSFAQIVEKATVCNSKMRNELRDRFKHPLDNGGVTWDSLKSMPEHEDVSLKAGKIKEAVKQLYSEDV